MPITIRAVYEKGVLRPLELLDLAEGTVVRLTIEVITPSDRTEAGADGVQTDSDA